MKLAYRRPLIRWNRIGPALGLMLGTLLLCPSYTYALDESESLTLLVRTLDRTDDNSARISLLKGILSGLEGRRNVEMPDGWKGLGDRLMKSENRELRRLAEQLARVFGDERAAREALARLLDRAAPLAERRAALRSMAAQMNAQLGAELGSLLNDPDLRIDAIRAYGALAQPDAAKVLLQRYASFDDEARRAVLETLSTRKTYATALLSELKRNRIAKEAIPSYVARALQSLLGSAFTKVYGDVEMLSKDKSELFGKYRKLLSSRAMDKADASAGRAVFERTCAACHVMYASGGAIGPDLTGSNRANLDYILLNILDPSDDIPDSYKMVTVHTKDGRVLVGAIVEEDGRRVTLNAVDQKHIIAKSDIESRVVSDVSMMPEGLLMTLKDDEVVNLIQYLRTEEQVEAVQ